MKIAVENAAIVRYAKLGRVCSAAFFFATYLLYLDDSGSAENVDEKYLVLGGVCVSEAQVHHLTRELDQLAEPLSPSSPHDVEFHASEIFSRRSQPWKNLSRDEARGVIKSVLQQVAAAYDSCRVFACAVHKPSFPGKDPMEIAFEDLCSRFDLYLQRQHAQGDRHRGIFILDKSAYETSLQDLAREFRTQGTKWRQLRHIAETPLFVNSKAARCVQIADHIAYAVSRRYQHSDAQYFDLIAHRFDQESNVVHGLSHKQSYNPNCMCLACMSRRTP